MALVLLAWSAPANAQAEGPFFEASASPRAGFELRLSAAYFAATRERFAAPVFLFAQPVQSIAAQELRVELDLRLHLTHRLALQAIVPASARFVRTRFDAVLISPRQALAPRELELSNAGIADPSLTLAYRLFRGEVLAIYAEGGARVALSDNPGGLTLPRQIPLGTGQTGWLLGAGMSVRDGRWSASAAYHFEYDPGNAATYLLRRVAAQAYTSGSLAARTGHHARAAIAYTLAERLSARLFAHWSALELPELVTRQGNVRFLAGAFLQELALGAELRFAYDARHSVALGLHWPLLHSFTDDPFFPITIPARGAQIAWHARGY
jgi:hypothetical protein